MIEVPCRTCGHAAQHNTLREALLAAADPPFSEAQSELVELLADKGPMTVQMVKAMNTTHIGSKGGDVTATYLRRMLTEVNRKLEHQPDLVVHTTSKEEDGGHENATLMVWIADDSEWQRLPGATSHNAMRDGILQAYAAEGQAEVVTEEVTDQSPSP